MTLADGTGKRVALVIGNGAYAHASALANPANDARGVAAALTRIGFSGIAPRQNDFTTDFKTPGVTALADLEYNALRRALAAFGRAAEHAGQAVLYYAGHGIEVGGLNYLIPVDAQLAHPKDVEFETASLMQVLGAVDGAHGLRLVILDACRDNPFRARLFPTREVSRGLRAIEPSGNILVAYAAKHGTVALDGKGTNSPFAASLLAHIETPGLEIVDMFREVKDDVLAATGNSQEPYLYGSLGRRREYLVVAATPEPAQTGGGAVPIDRRTVEHTYWLDIKDANDPALFEDFLRQFPDGVYAVPARCKLEALRAEVHAKAEAEAKRQREAEEARHRREERDRRKAEHGGVPVSWKVAAGVAAVAVVLGVAGYRLMPDRGKDETEASSTVVKSAKLPTAEELAKAEDDKAFTSAQDRETKAALDAYLKKYSRHADEAKALLSGLDAATYKAAEAANTVQAFKDYRDDWPDGQYFARAGKRIAALEAAEAAAAARLHTGESFRDCPKCPEMVVVPAGGFMMGSPKDEDWRSAEENPRHKVTIKQPFAVGKFEVTFAEWDACVSEGGCKHKPEAEWGRGRQPVMNVSWDHITMEYLPWLRKKTGKEYRLLSEAEWEYAARAGTTTAYSTGANITKKQAQFSEGEWGSAGKTVEVGSFPANAFGLHDMHGNVWEWTEDCYQDDYNGAPTDGSARTTEECSSRVRRGGSWYDDSLYHRSAYRGSSSSGIRSGGVGFRVSRTLNP